MITNLILELKSATKRLINNFSVSDAASSVKCKLKFSCKNAKMSSFTNCGKTGVRTKLLTFSIFFTCKNKYRPFH